MTLSKKEKDQLISIEKCERASKRQKIIRRLYDAKGKIEKPFSDKIRKLEGDIEKIKADRTKALVDSGLLYIDDGCGRTHPDLEAFNHETNDIIRKILRE